MEVKLSFELLHQVAIKLNAETELCCFSLLYSYYLF
jgi:hypothetical protein